MSKPKGCSFAIFELIYATRDKTYGMFYNVELEPFQIQMPGPLLESR